MDRKGPPERYGPVSFDTLKVYEELMQAGLEQEAARAVTEAMARAHIHRGATVADLKEVAHRLELRITELDRRLELQETRNRVGLSAVRKEGRDIRKDILAGITRATVILAAIMVLALILAVLVPHLPVTPWVDGLFLQESDPSGSGFQ